MQAGLPLPQRLHYLPLELQAHTGGRPEPRAERAGRGQAPLEKQELWLRGFVFEKSMVMLYVKDAWFIKINEREGARD